MIAENLVYAAFLGNAVGGAVGVWSAAAFRSVQNAEDFPVDLIALVGLEVWDPDGDQGKVVVRRSRRNAF